MSTPQTRTIDTLPNGQPRFTVPPLRLKQFTGSSTLRGEDLAAQRLISHGYTWNPIEALWTNPAGPDCIIRGTIIYSLKPATRT